MYVWKRSNNFFDWDWNELVLLHAWSWSDLSTSNSCGSEYKLIQYLCWNLDDLSSLIVGLYVRVRGDHKALNKIDPYDRQIKSLGSTVVRELYDQIKNQCRVKRLNEGYFNCPFWLKWTIWPWKYALRYSILRKCVA